MTSPTVWVVPPGQFGMASSRGLADAWALEAGLFDTASATWVLAVMARNLRDRQNGSAAAGPTLRARVSKAVYDEWGLG